MKNKESYNFSKSFEVVGEVNQILCFATTLFSKLGQESDIYELFTQFHKDQNGIKFLIWPVQPRKKTDGMTL